MQPQQSNHTAKLAALGIGLGLGVGGGVAGYKLLKPAVGKIVNSAETIANAAKTGIPQAADAVTGAANNAKSAMSIGSDMGKAWDWLKATRAGNQVKRGAWNLAHPVQYAREVKGGLSMMSPASLKEAFAVGRRRQAAFSKWKAGAKNPTAEQAALVRENLKKTIQQPKPPEANRPAWASGDTLFNAKLRLRELAVKEFADPKKEPLSLKQKVGIGAGLGAAAVGATLMPAAASMFRIKSRNLAHSALAWGASKKGLRAIIKPPKGDPNRHGRFVADYVDAAQSVLNKGVQGKIAGKVLQHAKANPKGKVAKAVGGELGDYGVSHYARFRSGPREAMAHWDSEVGDLVNHKGKQKGILDADNNIVAGANPNAVRTVNRRRGEMDRGRKAVNDEINEQLWHHGKSESEALRHVAENTKNKDSLAYFKRLAHHNEGAADKYAKISLAAPGLVIAGGATAGLSARRKQSNLSAKLRLRELARGDYAIPALGKMLKDRSLLEEFLTGKRGPKLGDLRVAPSGRGQGFMDKRDFPWDRPAARQRLATWPTSDPTITKTARATPSSRIGDYGMPSRARTYRSEVAKMLRKGRAGGDIYENIL